MFCQPRRNFCGDVFVTAMYQTDDSQQFILGRALQHVGGGSGAERTSNNKVSVGDRKHDNAGSWKLPSNVNECICTSQVSMHLIDEGNVRRLEAELCDSLG